MLKNIVFDVGKVLVFFEPDMCMDKLGFSEETKRVLNDRIFRHSLWVDADRGVLNKQEMLQAFIANAPEYEDEIRQIYEHVDWCIEMMPHTMDWLRGLKERRYNLYIISNYAENTYEKTEEKLTFLPYMDGTIFSYRYQLLKPEREIYDLLLETYHLKASECVFIDDMECNVEGARNAGYRAIQFRNYEQASQELEELLKG